MEGVVEEVMAVLMQFLRNFIFMITTTMVVIIPLLLLSMFAIFVAMIVFHRSYNYIRRQRRFLYVNPNYPGPNGPTGDNFLAAEPPPLSQNPNIQQPGFFTDPMYKNED